MPCPTPCPELVALQDDYETLTIDFQAIVADLRVATDYLLQLNQHLTDPAVARLVRERRHEKQVLAAIAQLPR